MITIILWILIILSVLGILTIIIRTIPKLVALPLDYNLKEDSSMEAKITSSRLEKFLKKIKILILKIENQISNWQEKLRKKKPE